MGAAKAATILALALCLTVSADSIKFDDKAYDGVYITETSTGYIVCFPADGRSENVSKDKVKEVSITQDAKERDFLRVNWQATRSERERKQEKEKRRREYEEGVAKHREELEKAAEEAAANELAEREEAAANELAEREKAAQTEALEKRAHDEFEQSEKQRIADARWAKIQSNVWSVWSAIWEIVVLGVIAVLCYVSSKNRDVIPANPSRPKSPPAPKTEQLAPTDQAELVSRLARTAVRDRLIGALLAESRDIDEVIDQASPLETVTLRKRKREIEEEIADLEANRNRPRVIPPAPVEGTTPNVVYVPKAERGGCEWVMIIAVGIILAILVIAVLG